MTSICLFLDRRLERDEESYSEDAERLDDAATLGNPEESEALRNITNVVKAYAFVRHVHTIHVHSTDMFKAPGGRDDGQRYLFHTKVTLFCTGFARDEGGRAVSPAYSWIYEPIFQDIFLRNPIFDKANDKSAE